MVFSPSVSRPPCISTLNSQYRPWIPSLAMELSLPNNLLDPASPGGANPTYAPLAGIRSTRSELITGCDLPEPHRRVHRYPSMDLVILVLTCILGHEPLPIVCHSHVVKSMGYKYRMVIYGIIYRARISLLVFPELECYPGFTKTESRPL
nr:hypothetical protein Itr_chr14CG29600 [Ipomoea trifida]